MDHLAEGFRGGALARVAMPWRSAASRSFLGEELGANSSFAGCHYLGVRGEDFERTPVILRGHDEGLLAHVGPDFQCGSIGARGRRGFRGVPLAQDSDV